MPTWKNIAKLLVTWTVTRKNTWYVNLKKARANKTKEPKLYIHNVVWAYQKYTYIRSWKHTEYSQ